MSLTIAPNERGVVRVFALSMGDAEATALRNNAPAGEDTASAQEIALGTRHLDSDFVEVFPLTDLEGLGLSGYLETGNGIDPAVLAPDKAKLNALGGWVLIAYSAAFGGFAQVLSPIPALKLIGTYGEPLPNWRAEPVETVQSARLYSGRARTTQKGGTARGMRMGRYVIAVLVALVAAIWLILT